MYGGQEEEGTLEMSPGIQTNPSEGLTLPSGKIEGVELGVTEPPRVGRAQLPSGWVSMWLVALVAVSFSAPS